MVGVLFITNSNAQKFDCSSKINAYLELLKVNKINEAFEPWSDVRKNCPNTSEGIYVDGTQILEYKIENAKSAEEKEKLVRDLMKLYDQYNKNFPLLIPGFEINKAMALFNNKIDAKEEIFNLLDSGFSKAPEKVTDATTIYTYFSMYCERFTAGDKKMTSNSVLEKFTLVSTMLNQLEVSNPAEANEYKTALRAVNALVKDLATCENLCDFYTKNFDVNKDNSDWLASALFRYSFDFGKSPANKPVASV